MDIRQKILWVDGLAAAFVGAMVFLAKDWLQELYNLSIELVLFLAFANILYATYSLHLAAKSVRSLGSIQILVFGNLIWSAVCVFIIILFFKSISIWGQLFLLAEAIFVSILATYEWRFRFGLTGQNS
jgi:hypothetical protein